MLIISAMLIRSANASGFRNAAVQTGNPDGVTKPREEVLTNDSIVKLVKHGLTEDAIINLINSGPEQFAFAANAIAVLQRAGVSEKIIGAMVNRDLRGSTVRLAPPPLAATARLAVPAAATAAEPGTQQQRQTSGTLVERSNVDTINEAAPEPPAHESLTNDSIIKMVKAGLSDTVIISVVSTQPGKYSLGADDIIAFKKAGVSDQTITAIVNRSASGSSPPPVSSAGVNVVKEEGSATNHDRVGGERSLDQDLRIPNEAGLYAMGPTEGLERIEGRATSFVRTGSRVASAATLGIHANRVNTQIPETRANVTLGPTPTFYYRPVKDEGGLDLILTRLTVKNGRRQFEVGAQGIFRASKGVSVRHQMDFNADEVEPGLYKLVLTHQLKAGQYAFYLLRGREHSSADEGSGFVYCFQVE
jgi:hypothetical protein